MEFVDRRQAGRMLAGHLLPLGSERPVVLALPRGGVPIAFEVAQALGAPLDILAVRKVGAPHQPELGVGALAEDGTAVLDAAMAERVGMTQELLDATVARETRELRRRVELYRDGRTPVDLRDRNVIIVDDGLATGLTALAAVRAARAGGAAKVVLAVPVGAQESVDMLAEEADDVVCLTIPRELYGVGRWYRDFSPVSDQEVVALLVQATPQPTRGVQHRDVRLDLRGGELAGDLTFPDRSRGLVIFAHGSGSSRKSPRNRAVATSLNRAGFATLLFDLLTEREAARRELVFDIPLLARRLEFVTRWTQEDPALRDLPVGYFGASTGAGAALRAAASVGAAVSAVVSRGGRPDLAAQSLPHVAAPTLLVVGGLDPEVLALNRDAAALLRCPHRLIVVEGAGHLFEEPGTLETVAQLARDWFLEHLRVPAPPLAAAEA